MSTGHRLARLTLLVLAYAAVSVLDRVLFAAELARVNAATADDDQHRPLDNPQPGEEPWWCQVCAGPCREAAAEEFDELEPFDVTDVVELHRHCCTGQAA